MFYCEGTVHFLFYFEGMVELVPSSDTLRKIQVEYGVTGSFKDKPLAEWLRKYNPAEDEYDKVTLHYLHYITLSTHYTIYTKKETICFFVLNTKHRLQ